MQPTSQSGEGDRTAHHDPVWIGAEAVHRALPFDVLIDALADAFAAGCHTPLRTQHALGGLGDSAAGATAARLLMMPAWNAHHLGVKLVNVMPRNRDRGQASVSAVYLLFGDDGTPRAIIDGAALTARRTAATSALASRLLSRPDARTLLVVGTGELAPFMARAHCAVRPIERVLVWGRRPDAARSVAARLQVELAAAVQAVPELDRAAAAADIISCATTSTAPLVRGAQVRAGSHVDLVGAFTPAMREADDALIAQAEVFVDTRAGALAEAGDLLQPIAAGAFSAERVAAELAELVRGAHPGRSAARAVTVFKSVGTALADLAAAELMLARRA